MFKGEDILKSIDLWTLPHILASFLTYSKVKVMQSRDVNVLYLEFCWHDSQCSGAMVYCAIHLFANPFSYRSNSLDKF